MIRTRFALLSAASLLVFVQPSHGQDKQAADPTAQRDPTPVPQGNGISVAPPKIYDDRTLQLMMLDLAGRLSEVSGFDRAAITTKFGNLQGYRGSQSSIGVQATARPLPGTETTVTTGTPSYDVTTAGQYPGETTKTPSDTTVEKTTVGAFTPGAAALPTYGSPAAPTAFSVSAVDALNEQVQLNYELMNLRLLLGGSLSDDYFGDGIGRRHITFGFPISIDAHKRYRNAVAEVAVTICSPSTSLAGQPILQNLLPKEKTYNVASLVSKSSQLGVGAVLANVVSVGGNFMSGRQTYYVVRDQDTIAVQNPLPMGHAQCQSPRPPGPGPKPALALERAASANSVSFAWQFRPVLGRSTTQQGMRQTFAQIAFPPSDGPGDMAPVGVTVRTCWRKYDRKTGTAGDYLKDSCVNSSPSFTQAEFSTTRIMEIRSADNQDGTQTLRVRGTYPPGTRVGFGDLQSGVGNLGFSNVAGQLRFTATNQVLATRGARILSPDGTERDIVSKEQLILRGANDLTLLAGRFAPGAKLLFGGKEFALEASSGGAKVVDWSGNNEDLLASEIKRANGSRCLIPGAPATLGGKAMVTPFSDSQVRITLGTVICPEFGPQSGGPYPWVATMAGRAYGLTDAPFIENNGSQISFLAPRAALQGVTFVTLKRMLASPDFQMQYELQYPLGGTAGISIFSIVGDEVTFAVRGSQLMQAKIGKPKAIKLIPIDDTILMFTLAKDEVSKYKQIVIRIGDGPRTLLALPQVKEPEVSKKPSLIDGATISRSVPQPIVIRGTNLKSVADVLYLKKALPFKRAADGASITISRIPEEMLLSDGMIALEVVFRDETGQDYDVEITP